MSGAAEWMAALERLRTGGVPPPGWLAEQRRRAAEGTLDPLRAQQLAELGARLQGRRHLAWVEKYDLLHEFVGREGRLPGPADAGCEALVKWIRNQRWIAGGNEDYVLSPERIAALEGVPQWRWAVDRGEHWWHMFELLRGYVAAFGEIPTNKAEEYDGAKLGRWVATQREARAKGLAPERAAALESVPHWRWQGRDSWQEKFDLLREYVAKFGRLPPHRAEYKGVKLGHWVKDQQRHKTVGARRMTPERISALEAVPHWRWAKEFGERWLERLGLLREFVGRFGRIPQKGDEYKGVKIGRWVAAQRGGEASGAPWMGPDRVAALEAVPLWRWQR